MRILHSADWHLGKRLYQQKREAEQAAFLNWLLKVIAAEKIDVLLVAGDIFDTASPPISAQHQYYDFLCRLSQTGCLQAVITGGNHDSPAFLNAPQALLQQLNIRIIGAADAEQETFIIHNRAGKAALIVSAVPYLRERDLRQMEAGETPQQKAEKTTQAIFAHYQQQAAEVMKWREKVGDLPAIAMGHLFTTQASTTEDDGERELYVGSLARVNADCFPPAYDYVALGHIHIPQKVGGQAHIRYSGSPIAMGFGEAGQQKQVVIIDLPARGELTIQPYPVPCFQALGRYEGDKETLIAAVKNHVTAGDNIWLELHYNGERIEANLHQDLHQLCAGSEVEILCIRNLRPLAGNLQRAAKGEDLKALSPEQVFLYCLAEHQIAHEQHDALIAAHNDILATILTPSF